MTSIQDLLGEKDKSLPAISIERISADVASALHYLHTEKHILHGDIKSGNVLVVGDCETAKLCDFGVTVPLDSEGKSIAGKVYVGTEAWSPKEVIMGDPVITSKADMFAFGLVIFEMISLHSPHLDKLGPEEEDDGEDIDEEKEELREAAFMAALGSRPPLPDSVDLDNSYRFHNITSSIKLRGFLALNRSYLSLSRRILEIFFSCTEVVANKRPSAAEVLAQLESEQNVLDDSILCINMIQAGEEEMVVEDDESIICLDDTSDSVYSMADDISVTPSAV